MEYTWKLDTTDTEKRVLNAIVELRDALQDRVVTHGSSTEDCITCNKKLNSVVKTAEKIIEEYKA